MIALLIVVCLLTGIISFLCSLTEAVLLSLNPLSLQLQSTRGEKNAARWLHLKQHIERPISAILLLNTLANTGLATLAGAIFADAIGTKWLWLFTLLLSGFVIFGGELAPKIIGVHAADKVAPRLIGPLSAVLKLAHPLIVVMEKFCLLLKRAPTTASAGSDRIMDIVTLVEAARAEQVLHNREEIIIIHAATLSARRVRTAMVPRDSVALFDARQSLLENVQRLGPKLHRSYPVSADGTPGRITGYIRVRELFVQNLTHPKPGEPEGDWHQLIRPVLHIDERSTLTQLLALYLDQSEIAVLVDNGAGEVSGWITMDDVMKVLMGQRV